MPPVVPDPATNLDKPFMTHQWTQPECLGDPGGVFRIAFSRRSFTHPEQHSEWHFPPQPGELHLNSQPTVALDVPDLARNLDKPFMTCQWAEARCLDTPNSVLDAVCCALQSRLDSGSILRKHWRPNQVTPPTPPKVGFTRLVSPTIHQTPLGLHPYRILASQSDQRPFPLSQNFELCFWFWNLGFCVRQLDTFPPSARAGIFRCSLPDFQ